MRVNKIKNIINHKVAKTADAFLDGMYLASSSVAYISDCATKSQRSAESLQAHFYEGSDLILPIIEMMLLSLLSIIANCTDKDDNKNKIFQNIAKFWPYFRDILSGLKNGRHAVVNSCYIMQNMVHFSMYSIANPIGIVSGILLAINLILYRRMNSKRKVYIKNNNELSFLIKEKQIISNDILNKIHDHSSSQRTLNFVMSGVDGITDGLYLYGCFFLLLGIGLNSLTCGAPLIISIVVISIITIASFVSKIHDEMIQQQKLKLSVLSCQISVLENQLEIEKKKVIPRRHSCPCLFKENNNRVSVDSKYHKLSRQIADLKEKYQIAQNHIMGQCPESYTFKGKCAWYFYRGLISGAKNAKAVIDSIKSCVNKAAYTIVFAALSVICSVTYACYLGIKSILFHTNEQKKNNQQICFFKMNESKSSMFNTMPNRHHLLI